MQKKNNKHHRYRPPLGEAPIMKQIDKSKLPDETKAKLTEKLLGNASNFNGLGDMGKENKVDGQQFLDYMGKQGKGAKGKTNPDGSFEVQNGSDSKPTPNYPAKTAYGDPISSDGKVTIPKQVSGAGGAGMHANPNLSLYENNPDYELVSDAGGNRVYRYVGDNTGGVDADESLLDGEVKYTKYDWKEWLGYKPDFTKEQKDYVLDNKFINAHALQKKFIDLAHQNITNRLTDTTLQKKAKKKLEKMLKKIDDRKSDIYTSFNLIESSFSRFVTAIGQAEFDNDFKTAKLFISQNDQQEFKVFLYGSTSIYFSSNDGSVSYGQTQDIAKKVYRSTQYGTNISTEIYAPLPSFDKALVDIDEVIIDASDKDVYKGFGFSIFLSQMTSATTSTIANEMGDVLFGLSQYQRDVAQKDFKYLEQGTTKYSFDYEEYVVKKEQGISLPKPIPSLPKYE